MFFICLWLWYKFPQNTGFGTSSPKILIFNGGLCLINRPGFPIVLLIVLIDTRMSSGNIAWCAARYMLNSTLDLVRDIKRYYFVYHGTSRPYETCTPIDLTGLFLSIYLPPVNGTSPNGQKFPIGKKIPS